jgi:hypothetical protein
MLPLSKANNSSFLDSVVDDEIGNKSAAREDFVATVMMREKVSFMIFDRRSKEYIDTTTLDSKVSQALKDEDLIDKNSQVDTWHGIEMSVENLKELNKRLKAHGWKWNAQKKVWSYPVYRAENAVTIMINSIMK